MTDQPNISDEAREAAKEEISARLTATSLGYYVQALIDSIQRSHDEEVNTLSNHLATARHQTISRDEKIRLLQQERVSLREQLRAKDEETDRLKGELYEAMLKLAALGDFAVADWNDKVVGEVDAIVKEPVKYKDLLQALFVDIPAERDRLKAELERVRADRKDAWAHRDIAREQWEKAEKECNALRSRVEDLEKENESLSRLIQTGRGVAITPPTPLEAATIKQDLTVPESAADLEARIGHEKEQLANKPDYES